MKEGGAPCFAGLWERLGEALAAGIECQARRQDPDTDILEITVTDVAGLSARLESVDTMSCETNCRHDFLCLPCCIRDSETPCLRVPGVES